jgi:crotonobetainyl-CoA:carnitine CoA-transferase CaiB-like acyl-CoA transferase
VAAANDGLFRSLCSVLGLEELPADDRFATNAARVEHRKELIPQLDRRFRERSAEDWLADLDAAGVPAGKVRSVPDALAAAVEAGRAATVTVDHPTAGPLDLVGSPIWGATRADPAPPPLLGEHTEEVLGELGMSAEEIADLLERGVAKKTRA